MKMRDDYIKSLVNKQSGEGENVYWIGLHMDVIDGNIQNAKWTDNSYLFYGNPRNLKPNSKPYGPRTAINGSNAYVGISKDSAGKTSWEGLPSGYTCTNECDYKSIELTQQDGQSAPIDEGFKDENNCRTTVLICNSKEPIASIAFGSKGTVQAKKGGKIKVRAKIYCAREETTKKVGWLRNVANNNPRLFFFVEEAHCEQQTS
ncbi:C-type lectin domain-containing protein [Meloidogyne graminicola]|uniref:C-type lectin domain-containing protein n=1 Tax=Meloidogyne graminicola TaxID=189291 RepID=A0A8S9ZKA6_9BILA|nr:C-type lectin domain-containing protein [Meloidogyne graminicola]